MPKITIRYVTWVSRKRRHQGAGKIDVIPPPPPGNQMAGDTVPLGAPSLAGWNDAANVAHTGTFAFWSITGDANGATVTSSLSTSATIGNQDVNATAWYIESGGTGPGTPGVWIDAFDVALGDFVDDDFVTVAPDDAAKSLTALANNDGFLATAAAETAQAFGAIHAVPFDLWKVVVPGPTAAAANLSAAIRTGGVAFAFYLAKKGPNLKIDSRQFAESVKILWGVIQDGGGGTDHGPVGPWDPLIGQLMAGLAQSQLAVGLDPAFRADAMALSAKQVREAANKIAGKIETAAKVEAAAAAKRG